MDGYQSFIDIQLDVFELRACPGRHKNRICNLEYIHTKSSLANEAFLARSRRLSAQVLFENYPSLFKYMYLFRRCFLLDFARPHSKNFAIISQISPMLVERAVLQTELYLCSGRRKLYATRTRYDCQEAGAPSVAAFNQVLCGREPLCLGSFGN